MTSRVIVSGVAAASTWEPAVSWVGPVGGVSGADHGSWNFAVQVATVGGRRARHRRGGYPSPEAAHAAGLAFVDGGPIDVAAQAWTVARWLEFWLGTVQVRSSTGNFYRQQVRRYLVAVLGRLRLDELTVARVQASFDLLARRLTCTGDQISSATVDRIRATVRSALNTAVREGILAANPTRSMKVAHPARPHPVVWTDERVAQWRRTGTRPPVAVWTSAQTARFLDGVKDDRLTGGVVADRALRGLRRGEVTGLRRTDLDSVAGELSVHRQVVALPGCRRHKDPVANNHAIPSAARAGSSPARRLRRPHTAEGGAGTHSTSPIRNVSRQEAART